MGELLFGIKDNSFLDTMSLVHFASGLGLGFLIILFLKSSFRKIYFKLGFIFLVIWELFEFFLRFLRVYYPFLLEKLKFIPASWAANESILNISSDLIVGLVGLLIIYFL